jgi:hypothetical protein
MRATLSYIEQPILFAASRGMSLVYRRFGSRLSGKFQDGK